MRRIAITGLMVLVLGVALAPAAMAAEPVDSYAYLSTFGKEGSASFGPEDSGVAVGQSNGYVFLAEQGNGSVSVYGPEPEPGDEPLVKINVFESTGRLAQNLAVDPTDGAFYVNDTSFFGPGVAKFVSDGQPTPTYTLDPGFAPESSLFVSPGGMAVDPTTGDLLMADRGAGKVYRFDSGDGSLVSTLDGPDGGAFQTPNAVAVTSGGVVYVTDLGSGRVDRFAADGTWLDQLALPAGSAPQSIAINSASGDVAVLDTRGQTAIDGFSATGELKFSSPFPASIEGPIGGIAWDSGSDRIYVNNKDAHAHTFVPAIQPGLDPPSGTPGRNTMHVEAEVAPGGETTTAWLEYCPATAACEDYPAFGQGGAKNPWKRGPAHEGLTATTTIEDDFALYSNASWKLRATAANDKLSNTSATTTVASPLLAPGVETQGAFSITETSAELTGRIDPIGDLTSYHFEYGLTESYGSRAPVSSEASAGNNRQPVTVSRSISGLQPETTYHYRLVATNGAGEAAGADRTFTTSGAGSAITRGYEMVTPVDQHGALVNGTGNFWSAADGSWFVTGSGGAEPDGTSATIWQHFLSRRGSNGWSDWAQIDPPRSAAAGTTEGSVVAVSDDGTHALVISNRVLDTGGIAGGGNFYVYDIDNGTYEFVGGVSDEDYADAYIWMAGLAKPGEIFVWGTPDFSSVVFRSIPPLFPGVTGSQLYRWSRSGGLELESTMPDGEPPSGEAPAPSLLPVQQRQVSDDGSVSYFSIALFTGSDYGVYRRANGQTTPISVVEGDTTNTPMPGELLGSSRDGRFALFSSLVPLTSDDPGAGQALYRYDAQGGDLTYLAPFAGGNASVYGISDDAQTVYFNAAGVASVARGDEVRATGLGEGIVSPSGRYFLSSAGQGLMLYDAVADSATCVSCLPDGSAGGAYRLQGGRAPGNKAARLVFDDGTVVFSTKNQLATADQNQNFDVYSYKDGQVTLISPGDGPYDALVAEAADEGRDIFFSTDQSLVPADTNNVADMYDARVGGGFPEPAPNGECQGEGCKGSLAAPPAAPVPGTSALGNGAASEKGSSAKIGVKNLSAADRATLAKGGKAHLKVKVNGPGKVTVTGKASGSAKAKKAGTVSVPISLSKGALSQLNSKGSLTISLTVHFKDAKPKVVSMTLRSTSSKKGGSR